MNVVSKSLSAAWWLGTIAVSAVHAEPFVVRNQHPMTALFGLPSPLPARLPASGGGGVALAVDWSNFATTEARGRLEYTLDGEVVETRVALTYGLSQRYALRGQVAYRSLGTGSLDGTIEGWHDAFGLPNGSRDKLPEDQLLLEYLVSGVKVFQFEREASGVADLPLALGYQLIESGSGALAGWLSVKAPVGKPEDLTGSGAADVALSLAGERRVGEQWQVFGQANLAWLGEGDLLPELQQDHAWSVMGGVSWNAWRGLDLTAQLEANSGVFDSGLDDFDGGAVVLMLGGSYRTTGGWRFDLGVSEDIQADASPDVVFNVAAHRVF
jgi:hypothetical protein